MPERVSGKRLEFHNVRPGISQQLGAVGASDSVGEVEDVELIQGIERSAVAGPVPGRAGLAGTTR